MQRREAIDQEVSRGGALSGLRGSSLALSWSAAGVLFLIELVLFVLAVPAYYQRLARPPEAVVAALAGSGVSVGLYAAYLTVVIALFSLGCFVVAGLIFWRQRTSGTALVATLLLVLLGSVNAPAAGALEARFPALTPAVELSVILLFVALTVFLFVFPTGRFVPTWTRMPVAVLAGLMVVLGTTLGVYRGGSPDWYYGLFVLSGVLGVVAQIYRYIRVSGRTERQQTKWVVVGLAAAIAGQIGVNLVAPLFPPTLSAPALHNTEYDLLSVTGVTFVSFLIPLSIGVAVVRYHLFDLDVVINRALVYGLLTLGISALYVLVVGAVGALLNAQDNLLVSLVGVGLVAAAVAPLRDRLQRAVNRVMYGQRDDPYGVLAELGQRLEASFSPSDVLPTIVETVATALRLPYVAVAVRRGEGFEVAASYGTPRGEQLHLPLVYQGDTVGRLVFSARGRDEELTALDRRLLDDLARHAGIAVHAVRLTADLESSNASLRAARERLVTAREEERLRLRRDLHDGLGPQLAGFTLRLDAARNLMRHDPGAAEAVIADLSRRSQEAVTDIRRLVYALRPPALDELGLVGALSQQAESYTSSGLRVTVEAPEWLPQLPAAVDVAAYRIAQEALTNVGRHAAASECTVRLALEEDELHLSIRDNGSGLPPKRRSGVGMQSMQERAAELGGSCRIESRPGGGARVTARLPLSQSERVPDAYTTGGTEGVQ